jgi:hypothetical protein
MFYAYDFEVASRFLKELLTTVYMPFSVSSTYRSVTFMCPCIVIIIRMYILCKVCSSLDIYRVFDLKVDRILIWVIYLLKFTTCYITQLTCIYSKCWKWFPFISMHLSTRFTMFLATFLSVLSFTSSMARVIFIFKILNFSRKLCLQWA